MCENHTGLKTQKIIELKATAPNLATTADSMFLASLEVPEVSEKISTTLDPIRAKIQSLLEIAKNSRYFPNNESGRLERQTFQRQHLEMFSHILNVKYLNVITTLREKLGANITQDEQNALYILEADTNKKAWSFKGNTMYQLTYKR